MVSNWIWQAILAVDDIFLVEGVKSQENLCGVEFRSEFRQ
jgi:hypothetical protein